MTDSQTAILFVLSKAGKISQKQLAEYQKLEKSTLNRNIQRLLQRKLVMKSEGKLIQLTQEGKILVNDIIPEWKKAMQEITDILGDDGVAALNLVIKKFYPNP